METEFQHLTPDNVRSLIKALREIRKEMNEFPKLAKQDHQGFLKTVPDDFYWANFYSLTFEEMLYILLHLAGLEGQFKEASKDKFILDALDGVEIQVRDIGKGVEYSEYGLTAVTFALIKSLVALSTYGKSINLMIHEALNGKPYMLFEAVKMDRSVVSNKDIAKFIALAEMRNDKSFMKKIGRAMISKAQKKTQGLNDFRYAVVCLHEIGQLEVMSGEEQYQLISEELGLYSSANDDPASMLRAISRMKLTSRT